MKVLEAYSRDLEEFALRLSDPAIEDPDGVSIDDILDGQPSRILRNLVSVSQLRQFGAFFTGRHLAHKLVTSLIADIQRGAVVTDPTCGAGDLLLACAYHLPLLEDLPSTLEGWGHRLAGSDIHSQFVRVTKARLVLLALRRGVKARSPLSTTCDLFPSIRVGDILSMPNELLAADCIVLNPPYSKVLAPDDCTWATGSVSQAALFMAKCIKDASPRTKIVAILPDVLRTGSRYLRWRKFIEENASVESVEIAGRFDSKTDVDVFMVRLVVEQKTHTQSRDWWSSDLSIGTPSETIGDHFEIRVGPVVPYRDPLVGRSYPYIHAKGLPTWESIEAGFASRNYDGTTFTPPFVVVRRTSRPGDKQRAVGTIITGKGPVAVENHLLVLKPRSGLLGDCQRLLQSLRSPRTSAWLDERIRCRHLTVTALRDLPWWLER